MTKPPRPLTGFAKDAWLRRQVSRAGSTEEIARRLQAEIASLKPRLAEAAADLDPVPTGEASAPDEPPGFDPFTPNVVVIVRTRGAAAAAAALQAIASPDDLRLLAREQRLSIGDDVADPPALRAAIVAAAERRIANRRAAAS